MSVNEELKAHASRLQDVHLRTLFEDDARVESMRVELDDLFFDYSRTKIDGAVLESLKKLAAERQLDAKVQGMLTGEKINKTENRAVLHTALRAARDAVVEVDGKNVIPDVYSVLDRIRDFSEKFRSGELKGATGKAFKNVMVIGIGGSYLGPEFVIEALKSDAACKESSAGRKVVFIANVDPTDFSRRSQEVDPEETFVVINSKTFTTAETMLNAKMAKNWLISSLKAKSADLTDEKIIAHHMGAVSTNLKLTSEFGINDDFVFGFWDWVGGRFSVWSAVGALPTALQYGYQVAEEFLTGGRIMDNHFGSEKDELKNLPRLMGLIGYYHHTICGFSTRALLPYSQALYKFAPHIQQLDMESNGKYVSIENNEKVTTTTGPIVFGEPGTNGQHSFYQLLHQGRVIPSEFIGFLQGPDNIQNPYGTINSHDELFSNFLAQPDALAFGKTIDEVKAEGVEGGLVQHKVFEGNRPSTTMIFDTFTARNLGKLLALYEHRVAVEGFLWGVNSFDQWGVELGKKLAKDIRGQIANKKEGKDTQLASFNKSTQFLLTKFLNGNKY